MNQVKAKMIQTDQIDSQDGNITNRKSSNQ